MQKIKLKTKSNRLKLKTKPKRLELKKSNKIPKFNLRKVTEEMLEFCKYIARAESYCTCFKQDISSNLRGEYVCCNLGEAKKNSYINLIESGDRRFKKGYIENGFLVIVFKDFVIVFNVPELRAGTVIKKKRGKKSGKKGNKK